MLRNLASLLLFKYFELNKNNGRKKAKKFVAELPLKIPNSSAP